MSSKKTFIAIGIISGYVLLLVLHHYGEEKKKYSTTSVFSATSGGLRIFHDYANAIRLGSIKPAKSAFLSSEVLDNYDALLILSPRREISSREARFVANFLKKGGFVFLSFHDEDSWEMLDALRDELKLTSEVQPIGDFENQKAIEITPAESNELFRKGKHYTFYSRLGFKSSTCSHNDLSCYVLRENIGEGTLFVMSGLPVISNVLITKTDNAFFAFELVHRYKRILVDEYRHFFTDKTVSDLLLTPSFTIPILGMVVGALLFFLFGRTEFQFLTPQWVEPKTRRQQHSMNEKILLGFLHKNNTFEAAVLEQARYLEHLFPDRKEQIWASIEVGDLEDHKVNQNPMKMAESLVTLHQRFLNEQRGQAK